MPSMKRKTIITIIAIIIVLSGLLALDLANRGLFWQFAWSVTGEEEPIGQLRGVYQWAWSFTRPQPDTEPLIPIDHTYEHPFGINTFLQLEPDPAKVEHQFEMISEAGFTWIRQQFPWEDIEVDGRGQFTDSRNDHDGDGQPDTISSWDKYDRIVGLAEQYGIQIQARLDNPPTWSRSEPTEVVGAFAPPDDIQDFVNYAVAVAEHYKGRIRYYQIWNEPNIFPEWGNQPVNPEGYTELLCRTYDALKAVDPEIVVISGAMSPTVSLTPENLSDFIFLQRMYNAGAGDCFDILSMQGYGLFSGPTDRRMRPTTINIGRNQYVRDIMVANGDEHKPIWISEAAWNFVPTPEEEPNISGIREMFGQVTQQQAADYIPQYYQRAFEEWPWIGVVNYWFFTLENDLRRDQPMYYFRMAEPDYNDDHPTFTPLPVYDSMKDYITTLEPKLYKGVHQAEHWAIGGTDLSDLVEVENAQFGQAVSAQPITFTAHGTDVVIRWRGNPSDLYNGSIHIEQPEHTIDGWYQAEIVSSLLPKDHHFVIASEEGFYLDSITVMDRTYENLFPYFVSIITGVLMLVIAIVDGLRNRK